MSEAASEAAIEAQDLVKNFRVFKRAEGVLGGVKNLFVREYRTVAAVDGISFRIGSGEMVGYIGPNGAGKSTTVKLLTGILTPDGGQVRCAGWVPHRDRRRYVADLGVVFGQRTQLWWDLAVVESLRLLARIYGVSEADFRERIDYFHHLVKLGDYLHLPVRKLSLGQRMRCDLVASVLHKPRLLFLDEPTIGLDVVAKERIRGFLRRIHREWGTTVVLTTNDLSDLEDLCRRILIIDHGKLIFDGRPEELHERVGAEAVLTVDLSGGVRPDGLAGLPGPPGGKGLDWEEVGGGRWRTRFLKDRLSVPEVLRVVLQELPVRDLTLEGPDIEEVVRKIMLNAEC